VPSRCTIGLRVDTLELGEVLRELAIPERTQMLVAGLDPCLEPLELRITFMDEREITHALGMLEQLLVPHQFFSLSSV
jgi:hypothetical protein